MPLEKNKVRCMSDGDASVLPVVFIFDLDQTMVGDADSSIFIKRICDVIRLQKGVKCPVSANLISSIVRPGLRELLSYLYNIDGVEIMVYSHGADTYVNWAVPIIERIAGIKFARPILSRRHTVPNQVNHIKSIEYAVHHLIPRYPALRTTVNMNYVLRKRTVLIDDRGPIVAKDNGDRVLQVRPYTVPLDRNILGMFPKDTRELVRKIVAREYGESSPLIAARKQDMEYYSTDTTMNILLFEIRKLFQKSRKSWVITSSDLRRIARRSHLEG